MAAALLLAGCVAQPVNGGSEVSNAGRTATNDLVTASDEGDQAKRSRLRLELASAYFAEGKTSTALDELKRALAADPGNASAYNLRGLIYASLSEAALAEESFRRALQLNPNDADAMHNYGWYLCSLKRQDEAEAQFARALAVPQYREQSKTWLARGLCQARGGDLAAAERSLLHSYELDAGNPATAYNLADVLLRRGDTERARFYAQRVNAVKQYVNAESLWLALRIEQRRGNEAAADELGRQLLASYPQSRQAQFYQQRQFDE
jgi:type IV pilus assembly protein PilF